MQPAAIAIFTMSMFFALTALITRMLGRDSNAARVDRGLRGYVTAKSAVLLSGPEETHGENLLPV
jgi:hypothetical protein